MNPVGGGVRALDIGTSPHIAAGHSVDRIMLEVVLALLPVAIFAVAAFGLTGALTLGVAVVACVAAEHVACRVAGRPTTIGDWSAVLTGLLYGLTLPPGLPLWMTAVGAAISIVIGKAVFGGLGMNPFNPALVGRAILQAAFPVAMTTWSPAFAPGRFTSVASSALALPLTEPVYDVITSATPLSKWKFTLQGTDTSDLLFGFTSGSVGETSAVLIALGGLALAVRRRLDWRIPSSILGTVAALAALLHLYDPARYAGADFHLLSGGLMLGAVFMATDMVGSPMTGRGVVLYGVLIGVLVLVIRTWGGMPEGVMYAILLGNAMTPHLDRLLQPRVYGTRPGAS